MVEAAAVIDPPRATARNAFSPLSIVFLNRNYTALIFTLLNFTTYANVPKANLGGG